jgi:FAD/FMN-containing dehydrogenase
MTLIEPNLGVAVLGEHMTGALVLPGDPRWDAARQAYNLTIDQQPAAIALPADAQDVQAVVRFASSTGLQIAPLRTGHTAGPLGSLETVILLKTDALNAVVIHAEALTARVGSGVKWESVVPRVSELGLAVLHGSTPDVSIAGYGLGGGVGWYARKHGLFTNSITAIELVTADGRLRRVDRHHMPELFWALRGGGGSFGVVTALEFRLFPISEVYAGILFFPWERSGEVLHAWHDWTKTVPDEMTSVGRIMQFPPFEELPEPLRGNSFVLVEAYFLGSDADGAELLAPLRALGPVIDTVAMVPPVALAEMHMDPPNPVPYLGEGIVLGDLPASAIDEFVAAAGPVSGSGLVSVEIRHSGGALARSGERHGALDVFPGSYLSFAVGMVLDEASAAKTREDLARVIGSLHAHRAGAYLNFEEEAADPAIFYAPETYRRLREIKASVDPAELFRANHPIPPAGD